MTDHTRRPPHRRQPVSHTARATPEARHERIVEDTVRLTEIETRPAAFLEMARAQPRLATGRRGRRPAHAACRLVWQLYAPSLDWVAPGKRCTNASQEPLDITLSVRAVRATASKGWWFQPGLKWRFSRATASSSTGSCLQNANRA